MKATASAPPSPQHPDPGMETAVCTRSPRHALGEAALSPSQAAPVTLQRDWDPQQRHRTGAGPSSLGTQPGSLSRAAAPPLLQKAPQQPVNARGNSEAPGTAPY